MNFLIPVTRFQVRYELGIGEPFSDIYNLVLKAIASGEAYTEGDLAKLFLLPERLVIEILVGLSKAGLIAIETIDTPRLVVTSQGKQGLKEGLIKYLALKEKKVQILMECLTGGVALHQGIKCENRKQLEKAGLWGNPKLRVPVLFADPRIDEGQISHLIRPPKGGNAYVRWIATPEIVTRNYQWLLVDADLERETVFNIPDEWKSRLYPFLLGHARDLQEQFGEEALEEIKSTFSAKSVGKPRIEVNKALSSTGSLQQGTPTNIRDEDLFLGVERNTEHLKFIFENALSSVLIITSQIDPLWLENGIGILLQRALARGLKIDILWGATQKEISNSQTVKWLQQIGRSVNKLQNLRYNTTPSGWRANVVIYDLSENFGDLEIVSAQQNATLKSKIRAVIASQPLLAEIKLNDKPVGIQVKEQIVVADVTRSAASLWFSAPNNKTSEIPDKWRHFASLIEENISATETFASEIVEDNASKCTVLVVRDQDHLSIVRTSVRLAQYRLAISSNKLDYKKLQKMLKDRPHLDGLNIELITNQLELTEEPITEGFIEFHSQSNNILLSDTVSLITTYDLLGKSNNRRSGDIGLLIDGGIALEKLWDFLYKSDS